MSDTIVSVQFRSDGAPARARVGTYPIYPSAIRFDPNARARYSIRYVPGTMTVSPPGGIQFTRKTLTGGFLDTSDNGEHTFALPFTPIPGRMIVVVLSGLVTDSDPLPTLILSTVKTGGGSAYTQIGTDVVCTNTDTGNPLLNVRQTLSVWWRIAAGGSGEDQIKYTTNITSDLGIFQLTVLEYSGANASPVTASVSRAVDVVDGSGGSTIQDLPDLNLNGTTGQLALAVFTQSNDFVTRSPVQYSFRYRGTNVVDPTHQDIDSQIAAIAMIDRGSLSGLGPEQPKITNIGPTFYAAIGVAFQKA